ncbi:MAG: hypothetical protein E6K73_13975 [Candidatus Eisenbacteria bacterium]|uniref:Uncharacterized protein n=1 Tax=Eiseniibacteriota bacterium TaxID=2212470 RepID=A0A538S762_UNCEI|nr:MAG: hypothetical protein E6K73_13975 [Candidatus Eisenbacteria bacterium]
MDREKLLRELADLPTSRLEQMYYRDAADWTEDARAVIRDALEDRRDRGYDVDEIPHDTELMTDPVYPMSWTESLVLVVMLGLLVALAAVFFLR